MPPDPLLGWRSHGIKDRQIVEDRYYYLGATKVRPAHRVAMVVIKNWMRNGERRSLARKVSITAVVPGWRVNSAFSRAGWGDPDSRAS